MVLNTDWALGQLGEHLRLVRRTQQGISALTYVGSEDQIAAGRWWLSRFGERMIGPRPVGRCGQPGSVRPAAGVGDPATGDDQTGRDLHAHPTGYPATIVRQKPHSGGLAHFRWASQVGSFRP